MAEYTPITFSDQELKEQELWSYQTQLPKDYGRSDYDALGEVMNTYYAGIKRREFENMAVDTSAYQGIEFNRDAFLEQVGKEDNEVSLKLGKMGNKIRSWDEYERSKAYVKHYIDTNEQVQQNFSTASMIALGLPMTLVDVDAPLIGATLSAVNKTRQALNLTSRAHKVAGHTVAGGLVGAESMYLYENTTGIYEDNSVTNGAMMGMLLGGSLGMLAERASKTPDVWSDDTGKIISETDAKVELRNRAADELAQVESSIKIIENIQKSIKENIGKAKQASTTDTKNTRTALQKAKEEITKLKQKAGTLSKESKSKLKDFETAFKTIEKTRNSLVKEVDKLKGEFNKWSTDSKMFDELDGAHKRLDAKYRQLKDNAKTAGEPNKSHLLKLRDEAKKELEQIRRQRAKLTKRMANWTKEKANRLKEATTELAANGSALQKSASERTKLTKELEKAEREYKALQDMEKSFSTKVTNDNIKQSDYTTALQNKVFDGRALLDPDNLKNLLNQRGQLSKEVEAMDRGELNLNNLRGLRKQKHNYVAKLDKELNDMSAKLKDLETFKKSGEFKRLDGIAKKMLISPIERLLNHDNAAIRGFASMLHSGTIHHGIMDTHTAWIIKTHLDERLKRVHSALIYNWKKAVENGYKGKLEEFEAEVANQIQRTNGKIQRELYTGISGDIVGTARTEVALKRAGSVQRTYFTDNEWMIKSVDDVLDYYKEIHSKGNTLGMESFKMSMPVGYAKRMYGRDKILAMGEDRAIQRIVDAQEKFARATNSEVTPEIMEEFRALATTAVRETVAREDKIKAVTKPYGTPIQASTSSLKQRTINAFDDDLIDVLDDDVFGTTSIYGLNTHGRLALKEKLGTDNMIQVEGLLGQLGASSKELDDMRVVIDTILGTREITKNPFNLGQRAIKAVSSWSSLMHTGAFGVPTMTEVASIAKEFGWASTMKHLVPNIREIHNMYTKGTPSDKNTVELIASYGTAYFSNKANRFDIETVFDSTTKLQEYMDSGVHKLSVLGGLLPITDALRMTSITAGIDFLAKLSIQSNITKTDLMRLADMGFGKEDLGKIKEVLQVQPDGRIGNMNRNSWGEFGQRIDDGLMTMVERTILHPNGITLPKFMTDVQEGTWISRIFMKFMRFPMESLERLMYRGMQEADAKQLMGLAGNIAMWSLILTAKDALKDEEHQKYNTEDGMTELVKDSMLYNSWTAAPIALSDKVYGTITGENFTNDYRYRLFGAVQSDFEKLQQLNPGFSIPFYTINIGDAFAQGVNQFGLLDDFGRLMDGDIEGELDRDYPTEPVDIQPTPTDTKEAPKVFQRETKENSVTNLIDELYKEFEQTEGYGDLTGAAKTGKRGLTEETYKKMKAKYGNDITEEEASKLYLQEAYNEFVAKWNNFKDRPKELQYALLDTSYNLGYDRMTNFKGLNKAMSNTTSSNAEVLINLLDTANTAGGTSKGLAKRRALAWNKAVPNRKITEVVQETNGEIQYYSRGQLVFKYGRGKPIAPSSTPGRITL